MSEKLQKILADLRNSLTELYGERLERLVLFGSQARGDAESDSDIDVLVVLRGGVDAGAEIEKSGDIAACLSRDYDTVISLVFVSDRQYATRKSPLLLNVRREGIVI
ncbi:nucleotidyltransferase domain-containing protein [candidate division KSB1 bacterium]|nr:MAG: nucleotidyltransferase domain-containing protein [candidate division KSB1 bacterium]